MNSKKVLNSGESIDVLDQIVIDGKLYHICKLDHSIYINKSLVRYIILPLSEFKDFTDKIKKDSDEILNFDKEKVEVKE